MEEINIWWEGSFTIEEILSNKIKSSEYDNTADKIGLYQIYGTHPLYGRDKLLYIGRTSDKKGFQNRLKNRWVIENGQDSDNINIYLGTIFSYNEHIKNKEIDFIEKAEVLLINALKPAFNSSNIQSVDEKLIEQKYIVYNHNNYRDIYPILSSEYFWQDTNINFKMTDKLAKMFNSEINDENDYYMFTLPNNENVLVGIDYKCWNETKQPIHLAILEESLKNKQKEIIKEKFNIIDYNDKNNNNYKSYLYLTLFNNLKQQNCIDIMYHKIIEIENILKQ